MSTHTYTGTITKKTNTLYNVRSGEYEFACTLPARLRADTYNSGYSRHGRSQRRKSRSEADLPEPPVVGDQVRFELKDDDSRDLQGQIVELLPRRNRLSRRAAAPMASSYAQEQVIAANLDLAVPIFAAAQPQPKWNMLDRYLVSAESLELPCLIVITKLDLVQAPDGTIDPELLDAVEAYRRAGYPVALVSAHNRSGLDELRALLAGKLSVFLGKSGVGKTSLLNALQPGLGLRVQQVSQVTGKGRHTTTHQEMFPLEMGGGVIDTPGVREFGLWNVEEDDLALFFPEMRPYVGRCQFGLDCWHDEEPGCAVRQAVLDGHISPRRYRSYLRLMVDA